MTEKVVSISEETIGVFKKFSGISNSMIIRAGEELKVKSMDNTVIGICGIAEEFPEDIFIYDMKELIQVLSLFESPALCFVEDSRYIRVVDTVTGSSAQLVAGEENVIKQCEVAQEPKIPGYEIDLDVESDQIKTVMSAANIMKTPNVGFQSDGSEIRMIAFDVNSGDQQETNSFSEVIDNTDDQTPYRMFGDSKVLRHLEGVGNFKMSISKANVLFAEASQMRFYIGLDQNSKYGASA